MNDIWAALVKDSTSTIDQYFDDIMGDLLSNILGKEWRVRQASCAAMADLVQGRPLGKYEKYLSQIWAQTFRVMDDVKSSVRDAAMSLARVLTSILIRSLEAGDSSSKSAELMLKNVLPFLLSPSGLESSATEVQAFALQTLLELIKKASAKTLRGFVPELVERLLGLLSSLEPQAVNYVHLNADKYGMTAQQIDDMRLTSIRSSPMMEAIERCLDLLDGPTMKDVCSSIQRAMKAAVGLPSKVGCSRVVVSLSTRHSFLFRVHADDFLQLVEKLVLDRNETVSSSYATACGYLVRLASDKQILRLLKFSRTLYFDSEGKDL
ncbi:MAG: proteasome component M29 [Pleopsidium flavum]|nr:MAG: proteasome component M29 [Pleopsidium flavum]